MRVLDCASSIFVWGSRTASLTEKKLSDFASLPEGWHYGEGIAPSDKIVGLAKRLLDRMLTVGFSTTDAFPGISGEIMLTAYAGEHYVEALIEPDGNIGLRHESGSCEQLALANLRESDVAELLADLARRIWITYGSSIENISTNAVANSRVWLSRIQPAEAFPSYTSHVQWAEARVYAPTFEHFTPRVSQEAHRYSYA